MTILNLLKRTRAAETEPLALVICTGPHAEYAGVALGYAHTGEVFVRYYDREWRSWFNGWWKADQVRLMPHGLTADEEQEVALALLETGQLPY